MRTGLLVTLCFRMLAGQDRYVTWNKDMDVCPKVVRDGPIRPGGSYGHGSTGGQLGAGSTGYVSWIAGAQFVPPEHRKDVSAFAALEQSGKSVSMAEQRGKVVVVGLWSVACEPSLYLLGEMAQLGEKAASFGFKVFPVNYDPERWRAIGPFLNQKRIETSLKSATIFTPGQGTSGIHCFMDEIPALPAYFILDRQGRVAVQAFGYKDGDMVKWLKVILKEEVGSNPAVAPLKPSAPSPVRD